MTEKTKQELIDEENIQKNYKWFLESCKKYRKKIISYKQFKKEFLETEKRNSTPEEQERLNQMKEGLNKAMEMLK